MAEKKVQLVHFIRTALVSPGLAVQPGLRPALRDDRGGGRLADDGRHLDVHLGARGGPAHRVRRRADVRATLSGTDATQPLQKIQVLSNGRFARGHQEKPQLEHVVSNLT